MNMLVQSCYLFEGEVDVAALEVAFARILEWYPVLASKIVPSSEGIFHWEPQEPQAPKFREQLRAREDVNDFDELISFMSTYRNAYVTTEFPLVRADLFRIDQAATRTCPVLRGTYTYALILHGSHAVFDGFATVYIGSTINNLITDPAFPCPLVSPQRVPVRWNSMLRDDIEPIPLYDDVDAPDITALRWDYANPQPEAERRTEFLCTRIPAGIIQRKAGVSLTDSFAVANLLCFAALALHEDPALATAKLKYMIPTFTKAEFLREPSPERPESIFKLMGSHTTGTMLLAEIARDTHTAELVATIAEARQREDGVRAMQRQVTLMRGNYADRSFLYEGGALGHILSNLGRVRFDPGPITNYIGGSVGKSSLDSVSVFPQGQPDGTILLSLGALGSIYSREFIYAYGRLWVETTRALVEKDFCVSEMFSWPVFRDAVALLPPVAQ